MVWINISLNETADPSKFVTELWEEQFLPLSYNSLSHIGDPWKMGSLFPNIEWLIDKYAQDVINFIHF